MSLQEIHRLDCPACRRPLEDAGNKVAYPKSTGNRGLAPLFKEIIFCTHCGLGMAQPEIEESKISDFYRQGGFWDGPLPGRTFKNALVPHLLAQSRWQDIERALLKSDTGRHIHVLDVGAGYGFLGLCAQKSRRFDLAGYTCVEPDESMKRYLRQTWGCSSGVDLQIQPVLREVKGTYHVVVLSHVLEHVRDPLGMLQAAASLLAEGGIALIDLPNQDYKFKRSVFPHLLFFNRHSVESILGNVPSLEIVSLIAYGADMCASPLNKQPPAKTLLISGLMKIGKYLLPRGLTSSFFMQHYGINRINPDGTWLRAICRKNSSGRATIGVVIPTKNRLDDLMRAVGSVIAQTVKPDELIIIDQSVSDCAREKISSLLEGYPAIKVRYTLNNRLTGLTAAKNLAVKISESDILLFIDDDIVLEGNFLEVIAGVYRKYPHLGGVGGMVRLPAGRSSALRRYLVCLFQLGPFRDPRSLLQAGFMKDREIVNTWLLSGGLSSLRRDVFDSMLFDETLTGASPIEDMDFYSKASKKFTFALALKAIALHNISETNRAGLRRSFELKCIGFCFIFSKHIPKTSLNVAAFMWRSVGFMVDALACVITYKTWDPVLGMLSAWRKSLIHHA